MTSNQNSRVVSNDLAKAKKQTSTVVVTVWYNREEHVETSLRSLLNQTAEDYTVLAVDDGSTDSTGRKLETILTEAQSHNVPMRVWRKPNEGFVSSIKQAIEEKTDNKIIALHGAGDISKPDRLQTQLKLLKSEKSVIATGVGVEKINSNGDLIGKKIPPKRPNIDPFTGTVPRLGTHGSSMYYRDSYNKAGGYRKHFVYAQDTDLLLRLGDCGPFLNTDEILYSKLVSEKTVSSNSDWKQNLEQIIYSAAALEAARCRKRGESDPITNIDPGDWDSIKSVAKQNGVHRRAIKRSGILAERCFINGDLFAVLMIVQFLGIGGVSTGLSYIPTYLRSAFTPS